MLERLTENEIANIADYLADELRIWNCYEQEWVVNAPAIIRFENRDVLVSTAEKREIRAFFLPRPEDAEAILDDVAARLAPAETCLCWRSFRSEGLRIGEFATLSEIGRALRQADA